MSTFLPSNCRSTKISGISNWLKGKIFAVKVSQLFMLVTKLDKEMVEIFCTIFWTMRFDQVLNGNSLIFRVESR